MPKKKLTLKPLPISFRDRFVSRLKRYGEVATATAAIWVVLVSLVSGIIYTTGGSWPFWESAQAGTNLRTAQQALSYGQLLLWRNYWLGEQLSACFQARLHPEDQIAAKQCWVATNSVNSIDGQIRRVQQQPWLMPQG